MAIEILKRVHSLAAARAAQGINIAWGFKGELEKLRSNLIIFQSLLKYAEERQITVDDTWRHWLDKVRDTAYQAEDVLDELGYEIIQRQLETQDSMKGKVCSFFSLSNTIAFGLRLTQELQKINERFDELGQIETAFGLRVLSAGTTPQPRFRPMTVSFSCISEVVKRRGDDVSKIINLLISSCSQQVLSVIPIVGMAGLGKTTVAKMVYREVGDRGLFDVTFWICVSDSFDVERILRGMLEQTLAENTGGITGMDAITTHLREELETKTFLLILDDVWNEDYKRWEILKDCLLKISGNNRNVVVVTTRSRRTASIMESQIACSHELKQLSNNECWSIIRKIVSVNGEWIPSELEAIGIDIAKRCGGMPLVARALGGMLFREKGKDKWSSIRDSDAFEMSRDYDQDKGHKIEELGCLKELRGRLRIVNLDHVRDKEEAKGANLSGKKHINTLVLVWSSERESSSSSINYKDVLEGLQPHQDIRSLEIENYQGDEFPPWFLTSTLNNLVVLKLKGCKKLPPAGHPSHLKILEIEGMDVVEIIGEEFYSSGGMEVAFPCLEELKINGCPKLESIPSMSHLSSKLVRLTIRDCDALSHISGEFQASATSLKYLTIRRCSNLSSIPSLQSCIALEALSISACYNLESPIILESRSLTSVFIGWCGKASVRISWPLSYANMKELNIEICGELIFSDDLHGGEVWPSRFQSLVIRCCDQFKSVPDGLKRRLHSLVRLDISWCRNLSHIPEDFFRGLNQLKGLKIGGFSQELEAFPGMDSIQHLGGTLEELKIIGWKKLKSLPHQLQHLTSLTKLKIYGFNGEGFEEALPEWLANLSSLQELTIWECQNLKYLPSSTAMQRLSKLTRLIIRSSSLLKRNCTEGSGYLVVCIFPLKSNLHSYGDIIAQNSLEASGGPNGGRWPFMVILYELKAFRGRQGQGEEPDVGDSDWIKQEQLFVRVAERRRPELDANEAQKSVLRFQKCELEKEEIRAILLSFAEPVLIVGLCGQRNNAAKSGRIEVHAPTHIASFDQLSFKSWKE
uniref:Disease resistance protein RGA3 n=1 Tax=Populus alba TaxID=43335 RepID=A0A4U5NRV2_POPAL|nr:hypothetical protein D5086_0000244930 [Populus alba]